VIDWFACRVENTFFRTPCDIADAEKTYFPNQRKINNTKPILSQWVRLEPLDISKHSKDLFQSNTMDRDGSNWAYLPYGPFATLEAYETWLSEAALTPDLNFFAIIKRADNKAVGLASYLRINP
jgi:hypothetical protein